MSRIKSSIELNYGIRTTKGEWVGVAVFLMFFLININGFLKW